MNKTDRKQLLDEIKALQDVEGLKEAGINPEDTEFNIVMLYYKLGRPGY